MSFGLLKFLQFFFKVNKTPKKGDKQFRRNGLVEKRKHFLELKYPETVGELFDRL